ncbi:MAG TPA: tripartite tricarboxylate transporter substrate-binding protein [Xanthobacteraceae bacterium]|nr:tripartite tricarboxylate transporter substrate-binding protein [Xanthobacteraceae bacterium]
MQPGRVILCASVVLAGTFAIATSAAGQSVAEFYKGKTIAIVMGTNPGGSYDLYGRVIGEHLSRYIPGNPTIIMEHMPGAGGVIAGNYIYGTGPQDGTKILLSHSIPLAEKLTPTGVRFESAKFQWLGTFDAIAHTMAIWHASQVNTIDALKTKPLIIGSFARSHLTYQFPALMKYVLGTNYQITTGYRSGSDLNLALERGEVHGWAASWENLAGTRPQWLAEKKVSILVSFTLERKKQIPNVPTLLELTPPDKKDVVEFVTAGTPFGRAMAVGPGVPKDRVDALRKAFDAVMKDPAFLADAAKRRLDIDPRPADYPHALANKLAAASPEMIARVKKAIGQDD